MDKGLAESLRGSFVDEVRTRLIGPSSPREELIERPNKRYLTGMVFPKGASLRGIAADEEELSGDSSSGEEQEELESPMELLFQKLPASVGLTFALCEEEETLEVIVQGARYAKQDAVVVAIETPPKWGGGVGGSGSVPGPGGDAARPSPKRLKVWRREPLGGAGAGGVLRFDVRLDGRKRQSALGGMGSVQLFIRRSQGVRIATVSLVNEAEADGESAVATEDILFQVQLECRPSLGVPAYPDPPRMSDDPEAEELTLQYRSFPAFAVGHGCAACWTDPTAGTVESVAVDFLPTVEVPPVTTDIEALPQDVSDALSLLRLQDSSFNPVPAFASFVEIYDEWCRQLARQEMPERFRAAKERILSRITTMAQRIREGVALLTAEPVAMELFRLANRAMLLSMARGSANRHRAPESAFDEIDFTMLDPQAFKWRPFQLAFILLSLNGLWNDKHGDRAIVDLIWFPTGGGKTEAYLAVTAFEILRRRAIDGPRGEGTAVIKRYTLRLLTIQQFERAGSLICALETLRKRGEAPGRTPFSLGLWVGKESSPNEYEDALADFKKIQGAIGRVEGVKVPLKQCPACSTSLVPSHKEMGEAGVGMRVKGERLELFCPLPSCPFHAGLPISYIDEYLYENPPTMLLGTIDKFAMLAWRDEARAFFGTDSGMLPPSLIIQDELHLISGPLGTLAGVYEAAIDTTISSLGPPAKYVCATATIRRAGDQIRKLYGRDEALFPPPGLDATDSFYSRVVPGKPGRLYIGTMGQGHTATFSNVIASAAILAAGGAMRGEVGDDVDTWWTLIAYHNSKRELGKTLSLARDDIPARLSALDEPRRVTGVGVRELSANLKDSEIPEALHHLAVELPSPEALDFVACTNMLSVGVDVHRLGLMMINGQPKTVSEYIQASSRVGRDGGRPPGIVFTLFSPTKPRDRSHYEFFRPFHKGFYRHVEPTSVTPFALPAQLRGLHGAFLAFVRMRSELHANKQAWLIDGKKEYVVSLMEAFLKRAASSCDGDMEEARSILSRFVEFWNDASRRHGKKLRFNSPGKQHPSLIKPFGSMVGDGVPTLQSLRSVDKPLRLVPYMHSWGK